MFRMDRIQPSLFPHYLWLGYLHTVEPAATAVVEQRATHYTLACEMNAPVGIRWIRKGHETAFQHAPHQVACYPGDNSMNVIIAKPAANPSRVFVIKVPPGQLSNGDERNGRVLSSEWEGFLPRNDSVLLECMRRLQRTLGQRAGKDDLDAGTAARQMVLRLAEIAGRKPPELLGDKSVFAAPIMRLIVEFIDTHLARQIHLKELSSLVGYAPSHFARKFLCSAGLSVGRFIYRRRLLMAAAVIQGDLAPLSEVAIDFGFSSQSHFTRMFSDIFGVTPAKFRRQFQPMMA